MKDFVRFRRTEDLLLLFVGDDVKFPGFKRTGREVFNTAINKVVLNLVTLDLTVPDG